jgi:tetratricopeptide (TPR) repeat protein
MQFEVVWRYVLLLVAPVSQSIVHSVRPISSPLDLTSWLWGACLVVAGALAFHERRASPPVALGVAWFLLVLVPSSSVAPLPEPMAEHRVYLASCGLFMAVASLFGRLARRSARWRPALRVVPGVALVLVVVVLAALTIARNSVWTDPVTLWRDAARKAQVAWTHLALAQALRDQSGCQEALPVYREAMRLSPQRPILYFHLRACLLELGREEEARRVMAELQAFDPQLVGLCRDLQTASFDARPAQVPECAAVSQPAIGGRR